MDCGPHKFLGWSALIVCAAWMLAAAAGEESVPKPSLSWPGAELFTNSVIRIELELAPEKIEALRKESREFVRAVVSEGGKTYRDVAVHLKGSVGSFRPLEDKPAFTLDFSRFSPGQKFHGLRRIHLNNSVEDPSYCNEQLGSELFRSVGIPAPRVTRAVVTLNHRRLGPYVLKEGFTEDFLACYFKTVGNDLYEPDEGHDVNEHLKRTAIAGPSHNRSALRALAKAALEGDPKTRWAGLQHVLQLDEFIRFMALEVMLCHRDGYCLARNNFRVYLDSDTGKLIFLPHGMDQLFGSAELPWLPHMAGVVAKAVLDTPEGKERYTAEFRSLFERDFKPEALSNRVDQLTELLRPVLNSNEYQTVSAQGSLVQQRIAERYRQLQLQLSQPAVARLSFTSGACILTGWREAELPSSGLMDQAKEPDNAACLHIGIRSEGSGSWRATAELPPGRYRFEGKARVANVRPLGFGIHQGAGFRIAGQTRHSKGIVGTSGWQLLSEPFEVGPGGSQVEFVCELRASGGDAWFELSSLRVVQEP